MLEMRWSARLKHGKYGHAWAGIDRLHKSSDDLSGRHTYIKSNAYAHLGRKAIPTYDNTRDTKLVS